MIRVRLWGGVMDTIVGQAQRRAFRETPQTRGYLTFLSLGVVGGKFCAVVI